MSEPIRAAGGVVWRRAQGGSVEVLILHRPRYDDWTFPKGKAEPGETDEDCARREVEEETGLRCTLETELDSSSYLDGRGRPKSVRYWAMSATGGSFEPHQEVDEIRWHSPDGARELLSYERDRAVLASFTVSRA